MKVINPITKNIGETAEHTDFSGSTTMRHPETGEPVSTVTDPGYTTMRMPEDGEPTAAVGPEYTTMRMPEDGEPVEMITKSPFENAEPGNLTLHEWNLTQIEEILNKFTEKLQETLNGDRFPKPNVLTNEWNLSMDKTTIKGPAADADMGAEIKAGLQMKDKFGFNG